LNNGEEFLVERTEASSNQNDTTAFNKYIYDSSFEQSMQMEKFRLGVERVLKALQFAKYDAE
jgi:hypothetical protein